MTHKEMMNIKYETCDLWNSLKDKSKIVDTLINLKEQNLKLKAELAEKDKLLENAIVPKNIFWGDNCYFINSHNQIIKGIVENINISNLKAKNPTLKSKFYLIYDIVDDYDFEYNSVNGYNVFATKEEAEEELKNWRSKVC